MGDLGITATAYKVNQMFWGKLRPGEEIEGVPQISKEFVDKSIYEVMCRRLLTDPSIQIAGKDGQLMALCQFLQMVRTQGMQARSEVYKKFTSRDYMKKLMTEIPKGVQGPQVCSTGWEFISPKFKNQSEFARVLKVSLRMAFLMDPLSAAVVASLQCTRSGNEIDLPWNACKVIDALNKTEYEITSIPNWMYAQGLPYVDNAMLYPQGVQISLTDDKQLYVLRNEMYVRIPFAQFKPAYEQGYLDVDLDRQTIHNLGWEAVSFYG